MEISQIQRKLPSPIQWGVLFTVLTLSLGYIYHSFGNPQEILLFVLPFVPIAATAIIQEAVNRKPSEYDEFVSLSMSLGVVFSFASITSIYAMQAIQLPIQQPLSLWIPYYINGMLSTGVLSALVGWVYAQAEISRKNQEKLRKQLEEKHRRSELFASAISHDLRNPLAVANGYIDFLYEEADSQSGEDYVEKIDDALNRMDRIVEYSLAFARDEAELSKNEIDLREAVEESFENTDARDSIDLKIEDNATLEADEPYVKQIFENLFRNTAEHTSADEIWVGTLDDGFYVEDNGSGVPENLIQEDLKYTNENIGFGLAIITFLADKHDWDIEIRNEDGARFEFYTQGSR